MSILLNISRVLGYDASRTWIDCGKAWIPGTEESKKGWEAASVAFKALSAVFSRNEASSPSSLAERSVVPVSSESGYESDNSVSRRSGSHFDEISHEGSVDCSIDLYDASEANDSAFFSGSEVESREGSVDCSIDLDDASEANDSVFLSSYSAEIIREASVDGSINLEDASETNNSALFVNAEAKSREGSVDGSISKNENEILSPVLPPNVEAKSRAGSMDESINLDDDNEANRAPLFADFEVESREGSVDGSISKNENEILSPVLPPNAQVKSRAASRDESINLDDDNEANRSALFTDPEEGIEMNRSALFTAPGLTSPKPAQRLFGNLSFSSHNLFSPLVSSADNTPFPSAEKPQNLGTEVAKANHQGKKIGNHQGKK